MSDKNNYSFNLRPSSADSRDFSFLVSKVGIRISPIVNLTAYDSEIEDQGDIGSCASHATTSAYENLVKQKYPQSFVDLSRLYHYYHTRYIENTVNDDYGVFELRNSLKSIKNYNICSERIWPYVNRRLTMQPFPEAYAESNKRTITNYYRINSTDEMIDALNRNYPIVVGMRIFPNFMQLNSSNPLLQMPGEQDETLGGHAVCLVGYSIPEKLFIAKNSFGKDWGKNGYCWIPFEYADKHIFDRWIFDINNQEFCRNANIVAIKSVSVPFTEIPNNNNNKEEIKMAENSYGYDSTLHTEHAAIRHDVGLAEANIRDAIGREACGINKSVGDVRYTVANEAGHLSKQIGAEACGINQEIGNARRETAVGFGDTRYNIATEACRINDTVRAEGQENVMATKDARYDLSTRIDNSADRIADRISEHDIKVADRFFTVGRDLADVRQGQATLAKEVELNALKSQLEGQKNTTYLSDKITMDGDKTRALINDLKYHDLSRTLVERNAELVEEREGRRHWKHHADQYQAQGQWAALQSQIQAFASQLQETRQGLVNFGTMAGNAGQQSSTSNNVR